MPHDSYDIEELHAVGEIINTCPFYQNKMYHQDADIVLLSYQYLLSHSMRRSLDVQLENAIIIIDEAHNAMQAAESITEFEI